MTKWQYGFAEYKTGKRTVEAYNNMADVAEAGKKTIAASSKSRVNPRGNCAHPYSLMTGPTALLKTSDTG